MASPPPPGESTPESAPDNDELTQLLAWRPPPVPPRATPGDVSADQVYVPVHQRRHLAEPDPRADRRGLMVVVIVAVLVLTVLVLAVVLSWPSHSPGPGWR